MNAQSRDCFGAVLNQIYRLISLRCHYGVVTVKQSQLFSLSIGSVAREGAHHETAETDVVVQQIAGN